MKASRSAMGPTHPPISWMTRIIFLGVNTAEAWSWPRYRIPSLTMRGGILDGVMWSVVMWGELTWYMWSDFILKWSEVSYGEVLVDKGAIYIRVTLYCGHLIILWLFHLDISCTVFVLICTVVVLYCFVVCVCVFACVLARARARVCVL
jgi:hypothetical protein